ncbi:DUF1413 domain-containing protein [Alkalihalobacillus sp. AL-G]|uniref:DUF1413 domain-containing protein n=1 Tax=Alkalihalobacillus sp. AL-G TaxID=2926399 RepID=UPI00351B8F41
MLLYNNCKKLTKKSLFKYLSSSTSLLKQVAQLKKTFLIRDLITELDWNEIQLTVRKNLGRMVMQSVLNETDFTSVIPDGKDSQGVQWYRKK